MSFLGSVLNRNEHVYLYLFLFLARWNVGVMAGALAANLDHETWKGAGTFMINEAALSDLNSLPLDFR